MFNIISSILIPAPPIFHGKMSGGEAEKKKQRYRKIPKISPGTYIFQKALFEGLVFGGAYFRKGLCTEGNLRFKIDWASL